ncbi:type II toxin-antitoxin system PemK/MazF family toxin [Candidatus Curtissbacteria bacterium]|nr:type II toxin-antitoxin system PemK/MazF family toxin [Candidatus Curtissbacteria bacterium]
MARVLKPKRGEIWVADLIPGKGWEVAKKRPVIVISANEINKISPLVIIIPISSQVPEILGPERILLEKENSFLDKNSVALPNQIRAIDKSRLAKKLSTLTKEKLYEVEEALKIVLGLEPLE